MPRVRMYLRFREYGYEFPRYNSDGMKFLRKIARNLRVIAVKPQVDHRED